MPRPKSRRQASPSNEPASPASGPSRRTNTRHEGSARSAGATEAHATQPPAEDVGRPPEDAGERPFGWSFRDFLVPYILLALSVQRAHGYFIEQYLRGLGLVNLEMSTLYRTLRQLEKDGLVHSSWEPGPEGPARRVYTLTDTGRWWLDAGASALQGYRSLIDHFFGSYSGPARKSED